METIHNVLLVSGTTTRTNYYKKIEQVIKKFCNYKVNKLNFITVQHYDEYENSDLYIYTDTFDMFLYDKSLEKLVLEENQDMNNLEISKFNNQYIQFFDFIVFEHLSTRNFTTEIVLYSNLLKNNGFLINFASRGFANDTYSLVEIENEVFSINTQIEFLFTKINNRVFQKKTTKIFDLQQQLSNFNRYRFMYNPFISY